MSGIISSFHGPYRFLSNFYPCSIEHNGMTFPTVEHAYQAAKMKHLEDAIVIRDLPTPGQAKRYGGRSPWRDGWTGDRLIVMKELIQLKFMHPVLRKLLLQTGDKKLAEGNNWKDQFWGVDATTGEGANHLGRILMEIREEIR